MKPWVNTIRRETGLIEHVCKCGVGHPAAASVHWMEQHGHESMGIHGCCGCCRSPEWQLADATEGYENANDIIEQWRVANERLREDVEASRLVSEDLTLQRDRIADYSQKLRAENEKVKADRNRIGVQIRREESKKYTDRIQELESENKRLEEHIENIADLLSRRFNNNKDLLRYIAEQIDEAQNPEHTYPKAVA